MEELFCHLCAYAIISFILTVIGITCQAKKKQKQNCTTQPTEKNGGQNPLRQNASTEINNLLNPIKKTEASKTNIESALDAMSDKSQVVLQYDKEAVEWDIIAAKQGYSNAQFNLGLMYFEGRGVPQDNKEAVKWFTKAAEQGDAQAKYMLDVMCAEGQVVLKDDNKAVNLDIKIADREAVVEDEQSLHDFLSVASFLSGKLKSEREKLFSACKESMHILERSLGMKETHVKTAQLDGEISNIIKSFQIVHVLSFINMQGYAGKRIGEFTQLLCSCVCETDLNQCQPYIKQYTQLKMLFRGDQFHEQFLRFSEDLACSIAGGPGGMLLSLAVNAMVVDFYQANLLLAVCAFGDMEYGKQSHCE